MKNEAHIQLNRPVEFNPIAAANAILPTLKETALASESAERRHVAGR